MDFVRKRSPSATTSISWTSVVRWHTITITLQRYERSRPSVRGRSSRPGSTRPSARTTGDRSRSRSRKASNAPSDGVSASGQSRPRRVRPRARRRDPTAVPSNARAEVPLVVTEDVPALSALDPAGYVGLVPVDRHRRTATETGDAIRRIVAADPSRDVVRDHVESLDQWVAWSGIDPSTVDTVPAGETTGPAPPRRRPEVNAIDLAWRLSHRPRG